MDVSEILHRFNNAANAGLDDAEYLCYRESLKQALVAAIALLDPHGVGGVSIRNAVCALIMTHGEPCNRGDDCQAIREGRAVLDALK